MLKEAYKILSYPLGIIFNKSLTSSVYSDMWKKANVIPIHKKDSKNNITNYRPISLISIIGKIMEKCVYNHMVNYIYENEILCKNQSGFIQGDSTINQLLDISNDIGKAIDQGKEVRHLIGFGTKA
jgi:hypothetical protein